MNKRNQAINIPYFQEHFMTLKHALEMTLKPSVLPENMAVLAYRFELHGDVAKQLEKLSMNSPPDTLGSSMYDKRE